MKIIQQNLGIFISCIIILFFIIYVTILFNTSNTIDQLFSGFYGADPVFCDDSGLELMILYLDRGNGFIMMKSSEGAILLADTIKYTLSSKSMFNASISSPHLYQITFKGIEYQDFFPSVQMLEFSPVTQRIKLYNNDDKTIHGVLYKNNTVTDVKELMSTLE
jgi:hypothetical protein